MNNAERVIELLIQCVGLLKTGNFSNQDLVFIKTCLEKMLNATDSVLSKNAE